MCAAPSPVIRIFIILPCLVPLPATSFGYNQVLIIKVQRDVFHYLGHTVRHKYTVTQNQYDFDKGLLPSTSSASNKGKIFIVVLSFRFRNHQTKRLNVRSEFFKPHKINWGASGKLDKMAANSPEASSPHYCCSKSVYSCLFLFCPVCTMSIKLRWYITEKKCCSKFTSRSSSIHLFSCEILLPDENRFFFSFEFDYWASGVKLKIKKRPWSMYSLNEKSHSGVLAIIRGKKRGA